MSVFLSYFLMDIVIFVIASYIEPKIITFIYLFILFFTRQCMSVFRVQSEVFSLRYDVNSVNRCFHYTMIYLLCG